MSSERLYYTDAYLVEFDAVVRDVRSAGRPLEGRPRPHGLLPDIGRPAFRYRHARRRQCARRLRSGRRDDRPPCRSRAREELARARPRRLEPALRSHAAAHRPASAVGGVRARGRRSEPSAFISARRRRRSISTRSCLPIRSPASKKRPTASCGKTAKSACKFVTAAEAAKLPLRKDPAREGELRIVEIKDYDLSACGGTHVKRTGAIGVICDLGRRAFQGWTARRVRVRRSRPDAAPRPEELRQRKRAAAVGAARRTAVGHREAAEQRAEASRSPGRALRAAGCSRGREPCRQSARGIGAVNVVAAAVSGWDANGLKKLASSIAAKPATVAVLITAESPALVVVCALAGSLARCRGVLEEPDRSIRRARRRKGAMAQGGGLWRGAISTPRFSGRGRTDRSRESCSLHRDLLPPTQ